MNDDFFDLESNTEEPIKMTMVDFVKNTRLILDKIQIDYSNAHNNSVVSKEYREGLNCDDCDGEGLITKNGIQYTCNQDYEAGDCFFTEVQYESFFEEIENILFHDDKCKFFELLLCDVIDDTKVVKK